MPWGSPIRAEQVDAKLAAGQFDALTLIHNETSTGVLSPLAEIAALKRKYSDVMFIVDAVSSLSAAKIEFDTLGIDVLLAGTQKALALPPGMALFPHDHRMWAAIGVYGGEEHNAFYRRDDGAIVVSGGRELREQEVLLLGDDVIHAVSNPRQHAFTAAIHVYGGDLFGTPRSAWTVDTLTEHAYDAEEATEASKTSTSRSWTSIS